MCRRLKNAGLLRCRFRRKRATAGRPVAAARREREARRVRVLSRSTMERRAGQAGRVPMASPGPTGGSAPPRRFFLTRRSSQEVLVLTDQMKRRAQRLGHSVEALERGELIQSTVSIPDIDELKQFLNLGTTPE